MAQLPIRQRWTPPAARLEGERLLKARRAQQRVADAAYQAQAEAKVVEAQAEQVLSEKVGDLEKTVDKLIENIPRILPASGGGRRMLKKLLDRYYDLPGGLGSAAGAAIEDFADAAQGEKADTAVQPARAITAGTGLAGGGNLSADRSLGLSAESIASLGKADSAMQPSAYDPQGKGTDAFAMDNMTDGSNKVAMTVEERGKVAVAPAAFGTKALVEAWSPASAPDYIQTTGYASVSDGGGALYKKVAVEPSNAGKIQAGDGTWYEIAEAWPVLPQMFGIALDAGASQSTAFQAMLDAGVTDVLIPRGKTVRLDTTITCDHDLNIYGGGTLDFSNGNAQLIVAGSLTQIDGLSANVTKHSQTLQWASSQGLAARDIILGFNPTNYSWGSRRAEYRDGFMFRIHSMSGNNANVYGLAVDAYTAADFDIYKMTAPRFRVQDIKVIAGAASSLSPLRAKNCQDVVYSGVQGWGGLGSLIEVDQCFGVDIDCTSPNNNSPAVNDEYGIVVANSHHVNIRGGSPMATRHCVTLGGYGGVGAIPNRYVTVSGMTLLNNSLGTAIAAADAHGCSDFVTFDNCFLLGAGIAGRNVSLRNSTVFSVTGSVSGECFYTAEVVGGVYTFENCVFHSQGAGETFAFIHLTPLGPGDGVSTPVETNMRDDLHVIVRNVTLITPNAGSLGKAVAVRGVNANKKINVTIDGLKWITPQGAMFLLVDDSVLSAVASDGLIVDNVSGPSGAYLISPSSDIASVPTREMRQSGRASVTTTAATSAIASPVSFRYVYSRPPSGQVSISLTDGSASGQTAGQNAIPKIYAISSSAIRPAMLADANFTASVNVDLHWSVGIAAI